MYYTPVCPYCKRAKRILEERKVPLSLIQIDLGSTKMQELVNRTGHKTLPQIFIDDKFIGGCDDLAALVKSGKFDEMIK